MNNVSFLKNLLNIYSPSGEEKEISNYLYEKLNLLGFNAHCDKVGNIIAKIGSGKPDVILVGHIDTVKGFIDVKEIDGKIYGRGSVDAKGPYSAFVCAVNEIKDTLNKSVTIIGTVEEEQRSKGAAYIIDNYSPDYVIIGEPSGTSGITLGYKGSLRVEYSLKKEMMHYSGKDLTAAENGVDFWNKIKNFCTHFSKGKKIFDALIPSLISINSLNDDYTQGLVVELDIRTPVDFDIERFKDWIISNKGNGEVKFIDFRPPVRSGKNNKLIRSFIKSIRRHDGEPVFKLKTGSSDMNVVAEKWNCPIVAYGPGESSLDHTPNEHISIEEYLKAIEILKNVISSL